MRYILHYIYECFVYSITEHPRIYRKGTKQLLAITCTVTVCLWLYLCTYIRQDVYYTYTLYDLRIRVLINNRIRCFALVIIRHSGTHRKGTISYRGIVL